MTAIIEWAPSTRISPYIKDGRIFAPFSDEVSLRKNLAEVALAHGWQVEQERVVPGWGRIDLVLTQKGDPEAKLVELKLDLTKPAKIRRAFQQADGYGRWWTTNYGTPCWPILVGVDAVDEILKSTGDLYPAVRYMHGSVFMSALHLWSGCDQRALVAKQRLAALLDQVAIQEKAIQELASQPPP